MSSKEPPNPFEELQKHLQSILKNPNVNVGFSTPTPASQESDPGVDKVAQEEEEVLERIRHFNLKPKEIRDHLDRYVIKQDEAKKVLSVAICDHYNHVRQCLENPHMLDKEYSKQNIIILGPTGVGKTYLMRNIAKLIGVPFVKADATKFSETGYVGADVEDLVRDLVKTANGSVDLAQYGIVYIDEIDKIATAGEQSRDVSGRGVQINLLKLMEDTEVNLYSPNDMMAQMQAMMDMNRDKERKRNMNTRHILFIVSGAFDHMSEDIKKRLDKSSIGFANIPEQEDEDKFQYLKHASTEDFINYGFEPEFVGRLPVRVSCESLKKDDLARILTSSEGSILSQYKDDFNGYEIDFKISPEAILEVAERASKERTGARGLMTILEQVFRDFKFNLPSTAIKSFEVTTDTINNPSASLNKILSDNKHLEEDVLKDDIKRYADTFKNEHGFSLSFENEAVEYLIDEANKGDKTIRALCQEKFVDFEHGLKIIARNSGKHDFSIDIEAIKNPDKELSKWVVASFKEKEEQEKNEEPEATEDTENN